MEILVVDDEKMLRQGLATEIKKVLPDAEIKMAENGNQAIEIFKNSDIMLVFLDIEMPGISGLETAKKLKEIQPDVNIIMTTAYSQYAVEAYKLHVGGYLLKPVDEDDIREELDNLKHPLTLAEDDNKLKITCFGEFNATFRGEPLKYKRKKSKELLAYLIAKNGATATRAELCDILWEGESVTRSNQSYLGALIIDLKNALKSVGMESAFCHSRNEYYLNKEKVNCDYYEFLNGNPIAIKNYRGEFMLQYSWGEEYIWDLESVVGGDDF
ncbi:MAG: response regulator [Lachnospiraceae bacterium]|nr:response regulator [Lachnospiraceae bacterium]